MGKNKQDGKTTKVKLAKDDLAFLVEATKYTKLEIKEWYRSFRKEGPAGVLRKADLHSMYLRYGNMGCQGSNVPTNPITITRIFPHWPMEQI